MNKKSSIAIILILIVSAGLLIFLNLELKKQIYPSYDDKICIYIYDNENDFLNNAYIEIYRIPQDSQNFSDWEFVEKISNGDYIDYIENYYYICNISKDGYQSIWKNAYEGINSFYIFKLPKYGSIRFIPVDINNKIGFYDIDVRLYEYLDENSSISDSNLGLGYYFDYMNNMSLYTPCIRIMNFKQDIPELFSVWFDDITLDFIDSNIKINKNIDLNYIDNVFIGYLDSKNNFTMVLKLNIF